MTFFKMAPHWFAWQAKTTQDGALRHPKDAGALLAGLPVDVQSLMAGKAQHGRLGTA